MGSDDDLVEARIGRELAVDLCVKWSTSVCAGLPRLAPMMLSTSVGPGSNLWSPDLGLEADDVGRARRSGERSAAVGWDCPVFVDGQGTWLSRLIVDASEAVSCS